MKGYFTQAAVTKSKTKFRCFSNRRSKSTFTVNICKNVIWFSGKNQFIKTQVRGDVNKFPDFFAQAFKIVVDS